MSNLAVVSDLKNTNSKEFLKNLCRDLSLTRLKKHSFIDLITQKDLKRKIENDQECQWVSVIFVKGENVQFIFKAQFVTEDAKHFAAKAYGRQNESNGIDKHQADEFMKEFCNLMGGGIKEQLEKNGVKTIMSLPLLTRGQDDEL